MTGSLYATSNDRLLAIVPLSAVSSVLVEQVARPVAALLTFHEVGHESPELEPAIVSLLEAGCDYFVCFGSASEILHDRIDDLALACTLASDRTVMTTWHDDEPAGDVVDFFFNVAGTTDRSLLLAALGPNDGDLARLLIERASV